MPRARSWRRHRTRESRGLAVAATLGIPACYCSASFPWPWATASAGVRRGSRWGATRVPSSACMEIPRERGSSGCLPLQALRLHRLALQCQEGARGDAEAAWRAPWARRCCWRGREQTSAPSCPWKPRRHRWGCRWGARKASYSRPRLRRPAAPLASAPAAMPARRTSTSIRKSPSYRAGRALGHASHRFTDRSQ